MGEETKTEVKKEEPKKKEAGAASKFVDFLGKVLKLFENIPKALVGIGLVVSLLAGGTGAWGAISHPDNKEVKELRARVVKMEIWNEALRERTRALIGKDKIEFDGYMLDLNTGDIEKLKP